MSNITITITGQSSEAILHEIRTLSKSLGLAEGGAAVKTEPVQASPGPVTPPAVPANQSGPAGIPAQPAQVESPAPAQPDEPQHLITVEQVRPLLSKLAQSGKREVVQALIQSFGAEKLSDIDPENFPVLLEKAQAELGEAPF